MEKSKLLRLFQSSLLLALLAGLPACGDDVGEEETELEINVERTSSESVRTTGSTDEDDGSPDGTVEDEEVQGGEIADEPSPSGDARSRSFGTQSDRNGSTGGDGSARSTTPTTTKSSDDVRTDVYDPADWNELLRKHVSDGRVSYAGFRNDTEFPVFVKSLRKADPKSMGTNDALAFWVNAYNALVIKNVLDHPGTKNPLDVKGFFDGIRFDVAGRKLTLNEIENDVIRPTYSEPLIHFGLVCAAVSCPPLIPKAYTGANVRGLLAQNARSYLGNTRQNRFEESSGTLYVSKIFEWYKVDFGNSDEGVITFVQKHGPEDLVSRLESADRVTVKYNEYDWTLNGM